MSKRNTLWPDRATRETFRDLVLNAPDAIVVISSQKVLFANAAAAALVGLPDTESMLGRDVLDFTPPEMRDRVVGIIHELHEDNGSGTLVEAEVMRPDGTRRDVELRACQTAFDGARASIVFVRDITDRKRAERDLGASEELYRQVVESMNEALVVYNADATVEFVNQQFCSMFACKPENVIGKPAQEIYSPEDFAVVKRGLDRRRLGLHDRYQIPFTGRAGESIVTDISAAPLLHNGKFAGSLALITDVTEQQRIEDRLRKSEQRYQEMADSSRNFIASFDCQDRYTAANRAVCNLLGLPEDKILGHSLEEVGFPPAIALEWRAQMADARSSGQVQTREIQSVFRQSPVRVLRRTVTPMYNDDGRLTGVSALSIDITEQKESEEKNQKLLRAIEEMEEVMFTTDAAGVITYVNPAFERIYGFTREEAIGKTPRIIRSGETPANVYESFWKEVNAGRTVRTEFINRRKDGQLVRIIASVSPIHDEDGHLNGFTAVQRDVTDEWHAEEERRKIEEQIARSAKMQALGTLAGGIAHDFNNILSIVMSHATVAEMSRNNPARIGEAISTIKSAVNRGASLSRQILTFARKTDVQFASTDLNRIVREIGSMVREMFPRNIHLDLELGPSLPVIRADSGQLHQALLNLCLNARDAMPAGGTLRLTTQAIGNQEIRNNFPLATNRDHVCLVVSDTGQGMNRETVSRIFEPFFTTKDVGKGSGLGLAVVYGVIKGHEGWINVFSELGLGTTFRIYFPASVAAEAIAEKPHAAQPVERGSERLLMIEDEPEIAEALSSQLVERGYKVVPFTNADEAVAHLRDRGSEFDVILSDLGIPGTSSRDLVRKLRNTAPGLPLIPMTGYIDPELHRDVVASGTQPILEKPFTIEQLLLRIREAAGTRMSS